MESSYFGGSRPEVARLLPESKGRRVLEIGCGMGDFRQNTDPDCEYWGVEPVPEAAECAAQHLHTVLVGRIEEVFDRLPDGYFDVIVCNDVIEHMVDHEWFLHSIPAKMAVGGCLVGSVPNVRYVHNLSQLLFAKDWRYEDQGILDRTHLRFFTRRSLLRALGKWQVERCVGLNSALRATLRDPLGTLRDPRRLLQHARTWALVVLLGPDTRWVQFGIRATPVTGAAR